MASESAILGVPAVYVNTLTAGTIREFEKNKLIKHITNTEKAIGCSIEMLNSPAILEQCRSLVGRYLQNKIDVTQYVVDTVENAVR